MISLQDLLETLKVGFTMSMRIQMFLQTREQLARVTKILLIRKNRETDRRQVSGVLTIDLLHTILVIVNLRPREERLKILPTHPLAIKETCGAVFIIQPHTARRIVGLLQTITRVQIMLPIQVIKIKMQVEEVSRATEVGETFKEAEVIIIIIEVEEHTTIIMAEVAITMLIEVTIMGITIITGITKVRIEIGVLTMSTPKMVTITISIIIPKIIITKITEIMGLGTKILETLPRRPWH